MLCVTVFLYETKTNVMHGDSMCAHAPFYNNLPEQNQILGPIYLILFNEPVFNVPIQFGNNPFHTCEVLLRNQSEHLNEVYVN